MADNATVASDSPRLPTREPNPLGPPVDFDLRGVGRQLPRTVPPEGWIRKIERRREGKVWVGFFHLWTRNADGRRTRTKKEKTLEPASMAKHEAQQKLAEPGILSEHHVRDVMVKVASALGTRTIGASLLLVIRTRPLNQRPK